MSKEKLTNVAYIISNAAKKIGAKVTLEPSWDVAGQICFKNGKKKYFYLSTLDINSYGSSKIASDKDYAKFFLKKNGYSIVKGKAFCSKKWAESIGSKDTVETAYQYAVKLGFPIIVKPNSNSQGRGVFKITEGPRSREKFERAFNYISTVDNLILVEQLVTGKEYRMVVLDNKVFATYQRLPFSVTGDGVSTIKQLIDKKRASLKRVGRRLDLQLKDRRMVIKLAQSGKSLSYKPNTGEIFELLDNANLSSGGDMLDVSEQVHPHFKKLAVNITKDMGLRLCGVDIMVRSDISKPILKSLPNSNLPYWIIEINASPGLGHYITIGKRQRTIAENLYLEILKKMERQK